MSETQGKYYPLYSDPGIKRDGTIFAGKVYTDGQWVRWVLVDKISYPRKMGGYKLIQGNLPNIPRGLFIYESTPDFDVYVGDQDSLKYFTMDQNGNVLTALNDVTPAGFVGDPNNIWGFDVMFSTISNQNTLIAHSPPNLFSITNNVDSPVYYGTMGSNVPLLPTGFSVSGGIVVLQPFLFMFGNSGEVLWTEANDPTTLLGSARIASQKIVTGLPARAGNSSPGGLLWSLDSLIRVTQVGTTSIEFAFDTVTSQSSILSSRCVVEDNGVYYWPGIDRFLGYNGTVVEILNDINLNFFYLNLDYGNRQKVWGTKIPQYGELVWFYPMKGGNGECQGALVFNKRINCWSNFILPRGCGYFENVFSDPVWADNVPDVNDAYSIWWHEKGVDKNVNGTLTSIPSFFTSGSIAWAAIDPTKSYQGLQRNVDLESFEPNFIQVGNMTMTVLGSDYASAPITASPSSPYTFTPLTQKIDTREQFREMYLRFDSNEVGGFYQLGQSIMLMRFGDVRP